jgi:hypothetical protein
MPHSNNGPAAGLQRQADNNQRAQEKIDRDPEEAKAILEPHTTVHPSAGTLTMQDMFGLFLQLQQQQAAFQAQLVDVLTYTQKQEARKQRATQEELEADKRQREATLEAWRTEPKEAVWIEPDLSEQKIAAVMANGEMPPRVFRINGLEYAAPVGQVVEVPASIAAMIRYTQRPRAGVKPNPFAMRAQPQGLPQIPDPSRGQFLAGSQEISAGQAGKSGEGRLLAAQAPLRPDDAQPLDVRYDAYGR